MRVINTELSLLLLVFLLKENYLDWTKYYSKFYSTGFELHYFATHLSF